MYSSMGKAIITMPVKTIRILEKARQRKLERIKTYRQIYGIDRSKAPVVISCKNRGMNHYVGQRYPHDRLLLATENWKKKKCDGDFFTIITSRKIISENDEKDEPISFRDMSPEYLSKPIVDAMENDFELFDTTLIQRRAIPVVIAGRNAILASAMGSGKTLAYLTPIVERLLRARKHSGEPTAGAPRALILSPTRELNQQVSTIARRIIDRTPPLDVSTIQSGDGNVYASDLDRPGKDLLISTVGSALRHRKLGALKFDDLRHVIVDEADTLLNESVRDGLLRLLTDVDFAGKSPSGSQIGAQLILVGSTIPDDVDQLLQPLLGSNTLLHIVDESIHRLQPHLRHRFVRLSHQLAPELLLSHVKRDYEDRRRAAVFVRDAATCEWLEHFLEQAGVPVVGLRGTMKDEDRRRAYERIVGGDFAVMVATDAASLGLDTRHLEHVINYQLPYTIGGYLRRAGRLGRLSSDAGRSGLVTTFVTNSWEVDFVQELEKSVRLNLPLNVNDIVKDRKDFED